MECAPVVVFRVHGANMTPEYASRQYGIADLGRLFARRADAEAVVHAVARASAGTPFALKVAASSVAQHASASAARQVPSYETFHVMYESDRYRDAPMGVVSIALK
jgi:hypothetical protein